MLIILFSFVAIGFNLPAQADSTQIDSAQYYFDKANNSNDYKIIIDNYTKAIKVNPDYEDAYYARGWAYISLGIYQFAINDFDSLIRINPDYADAYYARGFAYDDLGNYQQAIDDYSSAIKINPNNAKAYLFRGTAKWNLKLECCGDFKKACELGDQEACSWFSSHCK